MDETPLEASPEDVAEQRAEVVPAHDGATLPSAPDAVPWDADPADVAEQRAEVPLADDDWA
ncbi:MAG: hypothetical protein QOG44_3290 [Acidimicrobiaceae bacterium]|nr:hypothetical protein [Acidimicrobiaceae bacterium]MDQ1400991.1 hypothetical protein [Acidimicrobiaceae bacterium]MDQ1440117.1 hypothetical protein [Acidimicrobiaceae bacterium]